VPNNRILLDTLGIRLPIVQAPMAGVSSPAMGAAVTQAGALGSIGVGATDAAGARAMIAAVRERSSGALNVNLFCHKPAPPNPILEAPWINRLRPAFTALGATPPQTLNEIYRSFVADREMLKLLCDVRPSAVSFHFGLPLEPAIRALRDAGITLLCSVTSLAEARAAAAAGVHVLIAQGWEAGGHRGMFDPDAPDDQLGTMVLTRLLAREISLPIIAAGGMDGAGIAAALKLGAAAAQLGTAFIGTDESEADAGYRSALISDAANHTVMTRVISGRLARSLANRFTALDVGVEVADIPSYPVAYDLGKALHVAAKAKGIFGYGAQWAGQGAPLARIMPAARLVETLAAEVKLFL
jgi:nitronate monooxygenase